MLRLLYAVVGIFTLGSAAYLLSPWMDLSANAHGPHSLVTLLGEGYLVNIYGVFVLCSGLLILFGLKYRSLLDFGLFANFMFRLYAVLLSLMDSGLTPFNWWDQLLLAQVVLILWVVNKYGH